MRAIWATRGRTWGFRFLLDGGYSDPLPEYDRVFGAAGSEPRLCARVGARVALRFPDPDARQDAAGRVIPHDFVILEPLADSIASVDDGLEKIWPLVSGVFAGIWDKPGPPDVVAIRTAIHGCDE